MNPADRTALRAAIDEAKRAQIAANMFATSEKRERRTLGRPSLHGSFGTAFAMLEKRESQLDAMGEPRVGPAIGERPATGAKKLDHARARELHAQGMDYSAIGRIYGVHRSTVMYACKPDMRVRKKLSGWKRREELGIRNRVAA